MKRSTVGVSSTELVRHFGEYLARVRFAGERVVISKGDAEVAELRPLPSKGLTLFEFLDLWATESRDPDFGRDLEAVDQADVPMENPWES